MYFMSVSSSSSIQVGHEFECGLVFISWFEATRIKEKAKKNLSNEKERLVPFLKKENEKQ